MGFFFDDPQTYDVVKVGGWFGDQVVLEDVSIQEAEDYVNRRSGWGGDGNTYKIVRHRM